MILQRLIGWGVMLLPGAYMLNLVGAGHPALLSIMLGISLPSVLAFFLFICHSG